MSFELDDIVPWGRSFEEYRRMFALSPEDLTGRLLGCGDGPASFNAEAARRGVSVVSVDPLYACSADAIKERIAETHDDVLRQLIQNREDFIWEDAKSPERLVQKRRETMRLFLEDFRRSKNLFQFTTVSPVEDDIFEGRALLDGPFRIERPESALLTSLRSARATAFEMETASKNTSRYVAGKLPELPFADGAFDMALCSHLLFLYSDRLGASFHIDSIREMLRVAREVRMYPLLTLEGTRSPHVEKVRQFCREQDHIVERVDVDYEFQRGADQMLVVHRG